MRILMTGDTVGGVFTYACELARALAERGAETHLVLAGRRLDGDQRRAVRACGAASVHAHELRLEWMDDPWADVERAGDRLLELAADVEPELVHLNEYAHASLGWTAPTVVVAHSDVLSWHEAVGRPAGPGWSEYEQRVRAGLRAADLVVAPTAAMLRPLTRLYGPLGDTAVIPNGRVRNVKPRRKEPFVLAVGRVWDEAKNVAALERVAGRLPWPVLVAGDARQPLSGVRSLGRLSAAALDDRFARAAIFAAPAKYEPFGLAALEAALAGCALLLGELPSLREVWGGAALYTDPFDDEAIASAASCLIEDELLRCRLGAAARERAGEYTPARMADRYLEAYERLAGRVHA
jgi:glycosyltransferase involved in cell wall biosynthesis